MCLVGIGTGCPCIVQMHIHRICGLPTFACGLPFCLLLSSVQRSHNLPSCIEDEVLSAPFHLPWGVSCPDPTVGALPVIIASVCSLSWSRAPPSVLLREVAVLYLPLGAVPFVGASLCRELARLADILSVDAIDLGSRESETSVSRVASHDRTLRACRLVSCI